VSHTGKQESLTRREVTSSAALKNNTVKTFKVALAAGLVSLRMDRVFSVDLERNASNLEEW
jgi:hypothetical protein